MRIEPEPPAPPGSVSRLIPDLRKGDRQAMQGLWEHYFQPLVRAARGRLHPGRCRAAVAEVLDRLQDETLV